MEDKKKTTKKVIKKLIAKKDWTIRHNEHFIQIKKGEEVKVPDIFLKALEVEKVI